MVDNFFKLQSLILHVLHHKRVYYLNDHSDIRQSFYFLGVFLHFYL